MEYFKNAGGEEKMDKKSRWKCNVTYRVILYIGGNTSHYQ